MNAPDTLCTRCAAVIEQDGRFLLTGHFDAAGLFFWTFAGGLRQNGETDEHCAQREAWEETGLEVRIEKLLYHLEWEVTVGCRTELYFLARPVGGALTGGNDPHAHVDSPRPLLWTPCDELPDFPFRPGELKARIPKDAHGGFSRAPYPVIRFRD